MNFTWRVWWRLEVFLLLFLGLSLPAGSILNTDPLALVQNLMIVNEKKKKCLYQFH